MSKLTALYTAENINQSLKLHGVYPMNLREN